MIFNRFVREARLCVELAVEEARALGHDFVGDEDLLLGILASGEGTADEVLESLGITTQKVREKSEEAMSEALDSIGISLEDTRQSVGESFDMRLPEGRRIPFSPRAKRVLDQSLLEALRLRDNKITSEHVLLGILRVENGPAVRIMNSLGVSVGDVEERLELSRISRSGPVTR